MGGKEPAVPTYGGGWEGRVQVRVAVSAKVPGPVGRHLSYWKNGNLDSVPEMCNSRRCLYNWTFEDF